MEGIHGPDEPVYTIGVASRLLGVSPHMLRLLERKGLVEPSRTRKRVRLYSQNDLKILGRICRLMKVNGVNVAGVKAILHMEAVMAKEEGKVKSSE